MKKSIRLVALAAAAGLPAAALAATVTVLVQETAVRKKPQFYAPAAATARLGQSFEAEGPENGWFKTSRGYIHASAVTARKVKVGGDKVSGGASAEEVTLAGKGFNAQVEKEYAKEGKGDFSGVDAMERRGYGEDVVLRFLREGGLVPGGAQ